MVVGSGLLAAGFKNYCDNSEIIMFCSGVSNSLCTDEAEFIREVDLLNKIVSENINATIVYFSTCSIYDASQNGSKYVEHKIRMETFIKKSCKKFKIFRLSNVVGQSKNKNTILNYLFNNIKSEKPFTLWKNSIRNLIDIEDVTKLVSYIIDNSLFENETINIANTESYAVLDIVHSIEKYIGIKGRFTLVDRGSAFNIDLSNIFPIIQKLNIGFKSDYLHNLLKKYYSQ